MAATTIPQEATGLLFAPSHFGSFKVYLVGAVLNLRKRDGGWKEDKSLESTLGSNLLQNVESTNKCYGHKQTPKMIRQGKGKLVIFTNNCPALWQSEIKYYTTLATTGVLHDNGNNIELGTTRGKYHRTCTLAPIDPGDSKLLGMCQNRLTGRKQIIQNFYLVN